MSAVWAAVQAACDEQWCRQAPLSIGGPCLPAHCTLAWLRRPTRPFECSGTADDKGHCITLLEAATALYKVCCALGWRPACLCKHC